MKRLLWVLPACLLSSCLLNQKDPATQNMSTKPFLLGSVSLEQLQVSNSGVVASITAEFAIKPEDKTKPTPVAATETLATSWGRTQAVRVLLNSQSASRAPMCRKRTFEKKPKTETKDTAPPANALSRISVGKLAFGPALQTTFQELSIDKNLRYGSAISAAVPAGLYQVEAGGAGPVEPFGEILSVPEEVRSLRLNGMDFGNPTMEFDVARSLELFWREPAVVNDRNGVFAEVVAQDAGHVYAVTCAMREEDVPSVKGYKIWNLDSPWFSDLPRSGKVEFYFMRAHLRVSATKRSEIQLQATRTFYSHLPIKPVPQP